MLLIVCFSGTSIRILARKNERVFEAWKMAFGPALVLARVSMGLMWGTSLLSVGTGLTNELLNISPRHYCLSSFFFLFCLHSVFLLLSPASKCIALYFVFLSPFSSSLYGASVTLIVLWRPSETVGSFYTSCVVVNTRILLKQGQPRLSGAHQTREADTPTHDHTPLLFLLLPQRRPTESSIHHL